MVPQFYKNRKNNKVMKIIYFISLLLVFLFICQTYKVKKYGYLHGYETNTIQASAYDYTYKIVTFPNNTMKCIAKWHTCTVGTLNIIPWKLQNESHSLYIGNGLWVQEEYRKKGIANKIVHDALQKIISLNGFGIFSTSFELDVPDCVYKVYWIKIKPQLSQEPLQLITWNDVSYDNYPNHSWLNVPIKQRQTYLRYLMDNNNLKIMCSRDQKSITLGVESIIDVGGNKVSCVKWYWANPDTNIHEFTNSICTLLGDDYVAIPTLDKPHDVWDKAISYVYAKPKTITRQPLDKKDILGWFLDR